MNFAIGKSTLTFCCVGLFAFTGGPLQAQPASLPLVKPEPAEKQAPIKVSADTKLKEIVELQENASPPATIRVASPKKKDQSRLSVNVLAPRFSSSVDAANVAAGDTFQVTVDRANGEPFDLDLEVVAMSVTRPNAESIVSMTVEVQGREAAALLQWLPQESIVFSSASAATSKRTFDAASVLRYLLLKSEGREAEAMTRLADTLPFPVQSLDRIIDEEAIEITEQYIRNSAPVHTSLWSRQRNAQRLPNTTTFRVFLEQPERNEVLTLEGTAGIKMYVRGTEGSSRQADGMYHVVTPGGFSGTQMYGSAPGQLRITSLYHYPVAIAVPKTTDIGHVLGEFMLRRPTAEETADMRIELTDADNNPVTNWTFAYGPVTWGGPYGHKQELGEDGTAVIAGLAPQSFLIGFMQKPLAKDRSDIELKPGQITTVRFQLDAEGELTQPEVSYEPREQ